MAKEPILPRLKRGECLLLDGGIGSELQRRGVDLTKGTFSEKVIGAWSATAVEDAPDALRAVHEDYLNVGADIISTNTFWTNRSRLELVGLAGKAEAYTRSSVQIATDARDRLNSSAYVAGSVAPAATQTPDSSAGTLPFLPGSFDLGKEIAEHARVVADAGADLILLEFFDNVADATTAVTAVADIDLPVFLGLCQVTAEGAMRSDESFEQMAEALTGLRVDAILAMCSGPQGISASLPNMRKAFDLPLGAYANLGYKRSLRPVDYPQTQFHVINSSGYPPAQYADYARQWLDMGAQILGGCCASGPEHIAALRECIPS